MKEHQFTTSSLTRMLQDKHVAHASVESQNRLLIHFADGVTLVIEVRSDQLVVLINQPFIVGTGSASRQPTKRQAEYLAFIAKYIDRFGIPPAQADIGQHFMVSAPSVYNMVQTLERHGFISKRPGVPRSIRIFNALPTGSALKKKTKLWFR